MDAIRFDNLVRALTAGWSRRRFLQAHGLVAALSVTAARVPDATRAKKRKRKLKRNEFGCVAVGRFCRHAAQCCSGLCQGKKGKKKCKAHDGGGCKPGQSPGFCSEAGDPIPCQTSNGLAGTCLTTTGNGAYCAVGVSAGGECVTCRTDADCRDACGADAACIRCVLCPGEVTCATITVCP